MYAASTGTTTNKTVESRGFGGENMLSALSGKVSSETLTALENLMKKHKTEMDTLRNGNTQTDEATMKAKHEAFKSEMDALTAKYPELKTALEANKPQGKMGKRGGNHQEIEAIIATLPEAVQTELKNIRATYQTKREALRTEEKTKMDTVLSAYPEVKTKLDALKPSEEARGFGHSR